MSYNYCYACKVSIKKIYESNTEINLCSDCKKENYILINKTSAKKKFCLNEEDLKNLPKNTVLNKYNKLTTLYYYDDVVFKAHKKYGGASGLIKAQEKRMKRGNNLKDINRLKMEDKYNMIQCRRNLLFSELEKRNLNYYENINEFYHYADLGDESGYTLDDIIKIFIEYNFFYLKTNYKSILYNHKLNFPNFSVEKIKNLSKKIAINNYLNEKGDINQIPMDIIKKYKINL